MSTWIYLRCEDHDPPLVAEDESGQHLYDLPQLRADIASRDLLVAAAEGGMEMDDYYRRHTLTFLRQHPRCRLGIVDEYGREYPITEAEGSED